jgi:hypothetical protein
MIWYDIILYDIIWYYMILYDIYIIWYVIYDIWYDEPLWWNSLETHWNHTTWRTMEDNGPARPLADLAVVSKTTSGNDHLMPI